MIVLITGGCKNGKSNTAQEMAVKLSKDGGKSLYYVATMISTGAEDDERIKKHVENRKGLGFETLEIKRNIVDLQKVISSQSGKITFLIDSLTALLANEMFRESEEGTFYVDNDATARVSAELIKLVNIASDYGADLIFVSDGIYSDAAIYDKETATYREGLAQLEKVIAAWADRVIEMSAGVDMRLSGDGDIIEESVEDTKSMEQRSSVRALIIGGAGQGKRNFAKTRFGLSDSDIYCFDYDDADIPKGYRAYEHVERVIRTKLKNGESPETVSFFDGTEVIIIEDITCGIVPMDALDRKWREETGRFMQRLGGDRDIYRVFCGRGVQIR